MGAIPFSSVTCFLSVTHTPQLDQPEQFFTLLPLFLGHDRVIRPALLFELLPRVAHAPSADLPFLVQEHHRAIRVRPAEAEETAQVPAVARGDQRYTCLLYTSPSPRDTKLSRMPSSA